MDIERMIAGLNRALEKSDGPVAGVMPEVLNSIEALVAEVKRLREEVQKLKDENSRLKGEQGKPEIRKQTVLKPHKDISSEKEREPRNKGKKKHLK